MEITGQFCRFRPRASIVLWPPVSWTAYGTGQRGHRTEGRAALQMGKVGLGICGEAPSQAAPVWSGGKQSGPPLCPDKDLESHLNLSPLRESSRSSEISPRRVTSCLTRTPRRVLPRKPAAEQGTLPCHIQKAQTVLGKSLSMYSAAPQHLLQALGFDLSQPPGTTLTSLPSPPNHQLVIVLLSRCRCQFHVFLPVFSVRL